MKTTTIVLLTATIVVLLLLISCWKPKRGPLNRCRNSVVVLNKEEPNYGLKSDWGTGRQNTRESRREKKIQRLSDYKDWNSVVQYQSLDDDVYESHNEYTNDLARISSGASMQSVRSDDQYPIPWVGLRRPNMKDVYSGSDARVVSTEFVDQMPEKTSYLL